MLSTDAKKSLNEAAETYHSQAVDIQDYLQSRGIDDHASHTHLLGYVKDPVIGHEPYQGRLSIPYLTPSGLADLRFRSIKPDDSPKYLSRPGAEQHIYNVLAFQDDSDVICICEGEMDTIIMHSMVKIPAVGMPGSNGWKNWYYRAFTDYRKVLVLTDGDSSGYEMGRKIMQAIDVAVVVAMPDGTDVNEVFLAEGEEGMRKRMGL